MAFLRLKVARNEGFIERSLNCKPEHEIQGPGAGRKRTEALPVAGSTSKLGTTAVLRLLCCGCVAFADGGLTAQPLLAPSLLCAVLPREPDPASPLSLLQLLLPLLLLLLLLLGLPPCPSLPLSFGCCTPYKSPGRSRDLGSMACSHFLKDEFDSKNKEYGIRG